MKDAGDTISVALIAGLELRARERRTAYRLSPADAAADRPLAAAGEVALLPSPEGG